jgi:Leucine-rich repeat (LRR) protein
MKSFKIVLVALILLVSNTALSAAIPVSERRALIDLYDLTDGAHWFINSNWNGPVGSENTWYGVTTDPNNTTVIKLQLPDNNLIGRLEYTLGNLSHLQVLDLSFNNLLRGSIPTHIGYLTSLKSIVLSRTGLSGSLTGEIGNLTKLQDLRIDGCDLSGEIPTSFGNLSNLQNLNLGYNDLAGNIPPSLGNLSKLVDLNVEFNHLAGSIPPNLGNLSKLQSLQVSFNQLTGGIPPELGRMRNLLSLNLHHNKLTGNIPPELGNLNKLEDLYLDHNELSGSIPASLGNLSQLKQFHLDHNQLAGSLPNELGNLGKLQYLYSNDNGLSGIIPISFGNLHNAVWLELSSNQLTGTIPAELGNLRNLEWLNLQKNRLGGAIPAALSNLGKLAYLYLDNNQITGSIPTSFGNLKNLIELLLANNLLTGEIPTSLADLVHLGTLALGNNQLTGGVPFLGSIHHLLLNNNRLTGTIPASYGNGYMLNLLDLNSNQLTGNIPAGLGINHCTGYIDLSNNRFTGSIPYNLGTSNLFMLNLSNNQLTGNIPSSLSNLQGLQELGLNGNQLSGDIPTSLATLWNLRYSGGMNLGYNALRAADPTLIAFLNTADPDWYMTQTIMPTALLATPGPASALVSWTPIPYTGDTGGYRVLCSTASGGPYTFCAQTANKSATSQLVSGLTPGTTYYFIVQTRTDAHANNQSVVTSEYSAQVSAVPLIVPPSIRITAPNGGEKYVMGQSISITWASTGAIPNVKIEGSANNGANWTTVAASTANTGNFPITIPYGSSATQCLIRVSDASNASVFDVSDAVFSISGDNTEPNNDPASAAVLSLGSTINVTFEGGSVQDVDWYKFYIPSSESGKDLKVNVRVTSPYPVPPPSGWTSDIDFELLDGSLRTLELTLSGSDNETLYLHAPASGWYYVHVGSCTTSYADSTSFARYSVDVETSPALGLGYVTGRVVAGGVGIEKVWVRLWASPAFNWNTSFPTTLSDASGNFAFAYPLGSYALLFAGESGAAPVYQLDANVVQEYYSGKRKLADADLLDLTTAGQTIGLGNIALTVGAIVTGRVTAENGAFLRNAVVTSYDSDWNSNSYVYTNQDGTYTLKGVPVGGARLRIRKTGWAPEYFQDKFSFGQADVLATLSGATYPGTDAKLSGGGAISGTVKDLGGNPVGGILVKLYSAADAIYSVLMTNTDGATGQFSFPNVMPGIYKVYVSAGAASIWYTTGASFADATSVAVVEMATTPVNVIINHVP